MHEDILSDLIIKKVHSVSTMYTEKKTNAKRTNRPLWAIVIKYEGETRYTSAGREYISNISNIAVLPKGSNYDWRCTESGHFSTIEFDCEKTYPEIFSFNVKNGEMYLKTIKKMEINRTLKKTAYMLDELKDLYGIISSFLKTAEKKYIPSGNEQKILPAIEYIAKNYNKNISNDELAAVTGLSVVYFRKMFTETMGVSPIRYAASIRISKAKEMLKSDYGSISDIAQTLGYLNIYDFSRAFKKHVGIPPSKY